MSNITKKIFSIEQPEDTPKSSEPSISDVTKPLTDETVTPRKKIKLEAVPEFVTRDAIKPLAAPPSILIEESKPSKTAGWVILGFGVLYLIGAGLYFGAPLLSNPIGLLPIAGLILLLTLPLILLLLLWLTLRHLNSVSRQNAHLSKAADILVSPDREALGRTEALATGIREQISIVNNEMTNTVEAFKGVQLAVTRESQALDAAGLVLSNRSDEAGRNLTLQRQALESMSGTFDTRMSALTTQITDSSQTLDGICTAAETKLVNAGKALQKATVLVDETITSGTSRITENVKSLEDVSRKLGESADDISSKLNTSTETLVSTDSAFAENSQKLQDISAQTQTQISTLQATIGHGYEMLADLKASSETRATAVESHYDALSSQIKRSEDDTLAAQGQTARMVESNLAQMRRDFSRMETDLQSLQAKLRNLREESDSIADVEVKPARLNLMPLDSDFPPVEPPRPIVRPDPIRIADTPLNLGMDMEIESVDEPLLNFKPDVILRPGELNTPSKGKGFGRRTDKDEKSGWRWRDMLGTLERPDAGGNKIPPSALTDKKATSQPHSVDGVALLTRLKLSPAAIVDEGTVIDATQARINSGEPGLTLLVTKKLPEAVAHLKKNLESDPALKMELRSFTIGFANRIGDTPPTAPALRAAFGSPEGRAYLLCAAAFRSDLRV